MSHYFFFPFFIRMFYFFNNCIYLFLAVLGLLGCLGFSLAVEISSSSLAAVCRLLIMVASLADHRLQCAQLSVTVACALSSCCSGVLDRRLNSCGAQA